MFNQLRSKIARLIAPSAKLQQRQYLNSKPSRLASGWMPSNSSADNELVISLTDLRTRSRALIRDASYAKNAKRIVQNNVIGTGIGLQSQITTSRGDLNKRINDDIECAWDEWSKAKNCHTGGRLGFAMLERAAMGQIMEAGECFFRKHYTRFGESEIPYTLELIEAERIADDIYAAIAPQIAGNQIRMGVEMDQFYRPVAYYIRDKHPNEIRWNAQGAMKYERVPADQIIHLAIIDRWPQTRGEPWLHTAIRRLNDMDGYSEAEIIRARSQATIIGAIETPEDADSFAEEQADGSYEMEFEAGTVQRLNPGEKLSVGPVNSPNPAMDPFMRLMLREVASGVGCSYESLSRDYSQSNYSSSRLSLLEDRDLWRVLQSWFITEFRCTVHCDWMKAAVYSGAIPSIRIAEYALNPEKFEAVRFKPRGWTWVDPTKEVDAYVKAVRAGFTTVTDVIAATAGGQDIEDVLNTRRRELDLMEEMDLEFITDPSEFNEKGDEQIEPPDPGEDSTSSAQQQTENPATSRVFSFPRK